MRKVGSAGTGKSAASGGLISILAIGSPDKGNTQSK